MTLICTRCEGSGFLNTHQIGDDFSLSDEEIICWIDENSGHDVQVCDCCGDGDVWYGVPGEHYTNDDPRGKGGPYEYNGGLCECN